MCVVYHTYIYVSLIASLVSGPLCELNFVNHTVSPTTAKTTSLHQGLSRWPLSHRYQEEQFKSSPTLTFSTWSIISVTKPKTSSANADTQSQLSYVYFIKRALKIEYSNFLKTLVLPVMLLYFSGRISFPCIDTTKLPIVSAEDINKV